jgi:heme/copper-type cytochrome/quinol oxidase subunit 4
MIKFWKTANLTILIAQLTICATGTFYKHIAFGWGLGDVLWYAVMYFFLLLHFVLTIKSKSNRHFQILATIFFITTICICLQATIWRNAEYPWNGEIFYKN